MSGRVRLASAVVAAVGLAIAGYLTVVHYAGGEPVCAIAHGCAVVQQSDYAELAGIPVALLGLGGYAAILASLARDGEGPRDRDRVPVARGLRLLGLADLRRGRAARRDLHLVRRLGGLHDAARGAVGGARAQRAAARPPGVSVRTTGADAPQIPSGPQSAPAVECTQPRATASSTAQASASRAGAPSRACSASSVAGPPRSARSDVVRGHTSSVAQSCDGSPRGRSTRMRRLACLLAVLLAAPCSPAAAATTRSPRRPPRATRRSSTSRSTGAASEPIRMTLRCGGTCDAAEARRGARGRRATDRGLHAAVRRAGGGARHRHGRGPRGRRDARRATTAARSPTTRRCSRRSGASRPSAAESAAAPPRPRPRRTRAARAARAPWPGPASPPPRRRRGPRAAGRSSRGR